MTPFLQRRVLPFVLTHRQPPVPCPQLLPRIWLQEQPRPSWSAAVSEKDIEEIVKEAEGTFTIKLQAMNLFAVQTNFSDQH